MAAQWAPAVLGVLGPVMSRTPIDKGSGYPCGYPGGVYDTYPHPLCQQAPGLGGGHSPVDSHGVLTHVLMRAALPGLVLVIHRAEQVRERVLMDVRAVRNARSGARRHGMRYHEA